MTHESIEPATISVGKAFVTIILASTTWIDQLDISIRICGGILALAVAIMTIRKLHIDYKVNMVNKKLKDLELEEKIKQSLNGKS